MTEDQGRAGGPAFAHYWGGFERYFDPRSVGHLRNYCRGLLSDRPRKSVEPIALAAGTAVRTLPEFLKDYAWDRDGVRDERHRRVAAHLATIPDPLGTVGVADETSQVKKGAKTPGGQRQDRGCVGKTQNGVVTVHGGVARGRFQALLDADLYLPQSWDADRDRCREADIPDDVAYRPKWQLALDQIRRARANGVAFDWFTFDEGYGDKPGFRAGLEGDGLVYVGEVPRDFPTADGPAERVAAADRRFTGSRWRALRVPHPTEGDPVWEVRAARVRLRRDGRPTAGAHWLIVARGRSTGEVKYFASNAPAAAPLARLMGVAFARWNVEHGFRLAKSQAGMTHYEGRSYVGWTRHQLLCLVVVGFVAVHADGLRGEKPGGDRRAGVPGAERPVRRAARPASRNPEDRAHGRGHPVPPAKKQGGTGVETTTIPPTETVTNLAL
jgi:SRSO17 transposase